MHRSGTSALTRALGALGPHLGDNFLRPEPDNPTGFWEDRGIFDINERLLAALGLRWQDVGLIERFRFAEPGIVSLRRDAVDYLRAAFGAHPLWAFKDPRTVRVLPFWNGVLDDLGRAVCYLVVIRSPRSVARSLLQRQGTDPATAHRLWLDHMVPYFSDLAGKRFVVVDYDAFMRAPRAQLERIARGLKLPDPGAAASPDIDRLVSDFLDEKLRHSRFSRFDFDDGSEVSRLTGEAHLWLYELASDRIEPDASAFWSVWAGIRLRLEQLERERSIVS
jgi:hypothetical protein